MAYQAYAIGAQAIGSAFSAYGAYKQGQDIYDQEMANAELIELQSLDNQERLRFEGDQHLGAMVAGAGGRGIAQEGSFADYLAQDAANIEKDIETAKAIGALQAEAARSRARSAKKSGRLGAAGSLFSGGGEILGSEGFGDFIKG